MTGHAGREPDGRSRLAAYVALREAEFDEVLAERRAVLESIARRVAALLRSGKPADLLFVCTHNSRRSQMAQVWAGFAAARLGVAGLRAYSAGTESTAFAPAAVAALRRAGLGIETAAPGPNPVYEVSGDIPHPPQIAFSKTLTDSGNPQRGALAVMTCAHADAACPIVPGAVERFSLPYDDPGVHDDTDAESVAYDECCRRIAREMLYLARRATG